MSSVSLLPRSSVDPCSLSVTRQDIRLLEVLAGRVQEGRREAATRERLLREWEEEGRRRQEEKEEEERQVAVLVREKRRREEEEARNSLERAREAFHKVLSLN